jgi:catechol 2,3-dioxygenase-like lactoylglutathione lyase family enzyme
MNVRQLRVVIETGDYDQAVRFYRDVLGLPEELALDSDGGAAQVAPPTRTPWNSLNARLDAPAGLHITIFEDHSPSAAPATADQAAAPGI